MVTNQIMLRQLGPFRMLQRTKDGMFNATNLIQQWNDANGSNKELKDYFDLKSTQEFIKAFNDSENLHGENLPYVKSKARADRGGGTWMHPLIFIDFAMWINPAFKLQVLKFVQDQMLKYRDEAGDAYKEMSSAISLIVAPNIMSKSVKRVAEAVNIIVFGAHEKEMRNKHGDETLMKELLELEKKIASLITDGFIKDFESLMDYLRMVWARKYRPNVLR